MISSLSRIFCVLYNVECTATMRIGLYLGMVCLAAMSATSVGAILSSLNVGVAAGLLIAELVRGAGGAD